MANKNSQIFIREKRILHRNMLDLLELQKRWEEEYVDIGLRVSIADAISSQQRLYMAIRAKEKEHNGNS